MSDNDVGPTPGPWSWLHQAESDSRRDLSDVRVAALVVDGGGAPVPGCELVVGIDPGTDVSAALNNAVESLPPSINWVWILDSRTQVENQTLTRLLDAGALDDTVDLIGPALVNPQRRGAGSLIASLGLTITRTGLLVNDPEVGDLDQGQVRQRDALGLRLPGLLVRRTAWAALGGLATGLAPELAGVELGWLINRSGRRVVVAGSVPLAVSGSLEPRADDVAGLRFGGLSLVAAQRRGEAGLLLFAVLRCLGLALGKDFAAARTEWRALRRWRSDRTLTDALSDRRRRATPAAGAADRTAALLPRRGHWLAPAAERLAERVEEWAASFGWSPASASGLDDPSAASRDRRRRRRFTPTMAGLAVSVVGALAAGRGLLRAGQLYGAELLPTTDSAALVARALADLPGHTGVTGPPWVALVGWGSLIAFGQVEWLVTVIVMGCVPLAWLAAVRFLRQVVADERIALVGAGLYAILPALIGVLNRGQFGAALWAILLPATAAAWWRWTRAGEGGWRTVGAAGLLFTLIVAVVPAAWQLGLIVLAGLGRGGNRSRARQAATVALAPVIVLGPMWGPSLLRYPGRLLTGTEPALGSLVPPDALRLLVGVTPGDPAPPGWLVGALFGVLWLGALAALRRGPRRARWAYGIALAGAGMAVGLTRIIVTVPPGVLARPQPGPWLVLLGAGLIVAFAVGADELRQHPDRRTGAIVTGSKAVAVGVLALLAASAGWWIWAGQAALGRGQIGNLPPFVINAARSGTVRVLALQAPSATGAGDVGWTLVGTDYPRLGDGERSLSGDSGKDQLADSVARRLVAGAGDERLLADLRELGVGYLWLRGGAEPLRTGISNCPGLGAGSGDQSGHVWPVPGSVVEAPVDAEEPARWGWWAGQVALLGLVLWAAPSLRPRLAEPGPPAPRRALGGA